MDKAVLAGGCFWCTEAVYQLVKGVEKVISGYAGGYVDNPNYDLMHSVDTGHAECVEITFNPEIINYEKLLQIFYYVHDPTTLNQDGANYGTEYRSEIFYANDQQKNIAEDITANFAPTLWDKPIVTKISPLAKFYPAEEYHQNFYKNNPNVGYCQVIINPKLEKFRKKFEKLLI